MEDILAAFDEVEDLLDRQEEVGNLSVNSSSPVVTANDRALLAMATPAPTRKPRKIDSLHAQVEFQNDHVETSSGNGGEMASGPTSNMTCAKDSSEKALAPALAYLRDPRNRLSISPLNISPTPQLQASPFGSLKFAPDSPSLTSTFDFRNSPSVDSISLSSRLAKIGFVHRKTKLKKEKQMVNGKAAAVSDASGAPEINRDPVQSASSSATEKPPHSSTPNDRTTKMKPFTPYSELESSCGGNLGQIFTGCKENKTTEVVDAKPFIKDNQVKKSKRRMFGKPRHNDGLRLTESPTKQTF